MKNKKVLALLVLVIGVIAFLAIKGRKTTNQAPETPQKKRISEPVNIIPLEDRPYIKIKPHSDGRNVSIVVQSIKKDASQVEYELEYQAGTLLQGAFGSLDIGSLPASTKILLGSCSAGGACTYHQDVQGGSLLTRFSGGETYALKSDWRYFDNQAGETEFSSKNGKFQISAEDLENNRYLVIFNTAGYPAEPEGRVVSDPYSLTSASKLSGAAKLTIRATEEGELAIMGYDGTEWQEFESTTQEKMVTAQVELMELYLVVMK